MLEDRDYMRQPEFRERRVSFTVVLLMVNAAVFLVQMTAANYARGIYIEDHFFALSVAGLKQGFVWQLFTYQFMHAGLMHILLNCWAIYVFGRAIEEALGGKKFLALFLTSGVVGGLFQVAAMSIWPEHFGAHVIDGRIVGGAVVGASAGAFGLVAAFAVLFPERQLTLLLFFILPLRLTAKMLLILSAALAVFGVVFPMDNVANAAHLGGMFAGIVFIRRLIQGGWPQWKFPSRRAAPREFAATYAGKKNFWRTGAAKPDEELSAEEFLQKEVDPILDKISAHGIQSLTPRERDILEKARAKMAKRQPFKETPEK